jgi:hypothetical protein
MLGPHRERFVLVLGCLALLATGCATATTDLPPQAVSGLVELRSALIDAKGQVQKTTSAARDMVDRPRQDVGAQINAFSGALAKLNGDALQTRQLAAGAQARTEDYFTQWDAQLKTLSGQLAEAGQQRRQESAASFAKLQERVGALRTQFAPFMTDLQATDRFLKADPTASGVKAATPTLRKALNQEAGILKSADEVIAQIDVVRGGK